MSYNSSLSFSPRVFRTFFFSLLGFGHRALNLTAILATDFRDFVLGLIEKQQKLSPGIINFLKLLVVATFSVFKSTFYFCWIFTNNLVSCYQDYPLKKNIEV